MKTAVCEAPGIAFVCNVWKWFGQDMEMQTPPSLWSCSSRHASAIASTRSRVHYRHFAALDAQDDYCIYLFFTPQRKIQENEQSNHTRKDA